MNKPSITCESLTKQFGENEGAICVINDVTAAIYPGDEIAIVGSSGSGKTTFLQLLGGLDKPSKGTVYWDGMDLQTLTPHSIASVRNKKLGFVYQFHHLLPEFTAIENVSMPLRIRRAKTEEAMEKAAEALKAVGLAHRLDHLPSQLSGGERQRVAIARAIVHDPTYVLADEPTGNLDRKTAQGVFEVLRSLNQARGIALVLVTHDQTIADTMQTQWWLVDGKLSKTRI